MRMTSILCESQEAGKLASSKWGLKSGNFLAYLDGYKPERVPKAQKFLKVEKNQLPPRPKPTPIDKAVQVIVKLVLFSMTAALIWFLWNTVLIDACSVLKPIGFIGSCGILLFINIIRNLGKVSTK